MLLEPRTLELSDRAPELLERLERSPTFKLELPASQLEITTPPHRDVPSAMRDLAASRARLLEASEGHVRPAVAGVHPFSAVEGRLNSGSRYDPTASEYGIIARSQLVCALQIHVAVGGAARTLAVYNGLRGHLPELAALAANSPVYQGRLTGLAAVRPKISELLPRQGIPPHLKSWDELAGELRWGAAPVSFPTRGRGGGSCDLILATARSSCACRMPRPRSPMPALWRLSRTLWWYCWLSVTMPATAWTTRPLAHRGEPLVGVPPRRGRHARGPRYGRAAADPPMPSCAPGSNSSPSPIGSRARPRSSAPAGSSSATALWSSETWSPARARSVSHGGSPIAFATERVVCPTGRG